MTISPVIKSQILESTYGYLGGDLSDALDKMVAINFKNNTNPFEIIFNNTLHEKINLANIKILGSNKLKANKKGDEGKN